MKEEDCNMEEKLYFLHHPATKSNIFYREDEWGIEKVQGSDINMNNMCFVTDDKPYKDRTGLRIVNIEIPRKKKGEWSFDYCAPPISFTQVCEIMMSKYEYCILHNFALAVRFETLEEVEQAIYQDPKCFFWATRLNSMGPYIIIFDPHPPQAREGHLIGNDLKRYNQTIIRNLSRLDK